MADKILIMDKTEWKNGFKQITRLIGNKGDETIYVEYVDNDDGKISYDTVELATHVDDIVKMRDFLNIIISKIGPAGEYTADNIFIKASVEAN